MKLISLLMAIMLVGCATVDDTHKNAPSAKTLFIPNSSPQKIANCAANEMRVKYPNAIVIEKEGIYYLNVIIETILATSCIAEISFIPKHNGTFIELRRRSHTTQWQENYLWDCVEKCAGK
jgi:N12 class adenine-specific DNA methylase